MTIFYDLRLVARSRGLKSALATTASLLFLAIAAASGLASPYEYQKAFSEELSKTVPGGSFAAPWGLAFDQAGNLYITDVRGHDGHGIVDKFDQDNTFQAQLGGKALSTEYIYDVAVDDQTGHLYLGETEPISEPLFSDVVALDASGEELSRWSGAGTPAKTFGAGCCRVRVAVDNSPSASKGDVYVMTRRGGGEVDVLEPRGGDKEEGKFVRKLEAPGGFAFGGDEDLAIDDANGEVYVADEEHKVVDRFSPTGAFESQITGPSPGQDFTEPLGVAVDGATGDVYVIDHGRGGLGSGIDTVDKFGPAGELLNKITQTGPDEPLLAPVGVAVQEVGPHAGDVYVSEQGKEAVDVFAEEAPAAPVVESEGVSQLSSDSASLDAAINPEGAPSEYRFEYGQCLPADGISSCASSSYTQSVPVPDASLGAEDFATHSVPPVRIGGLTAGTTYHFRVVAHNEPGADTGHERTFTTEPLAGAFELPDDRVWELVSPPEKQGALIGPISNYGIVEAATDGSSIAYLTSEPTELELPGYASGAQVLSARGAGGWNSHDLVIAHSAPTGSGDNSAPEYRFFAEDLSSALVQPLGEFDPGVSSEASEQTPYLRTLGSCDESCFRPLVSGRAGFANVPPGTAFGEDQPCEEQPAEGVSLECGPIFWDATPDARHAVLSSAAPLTPGGGRHELYEWTGGALNLISILPPNGRGEELPAPTGPVIESQPLLGAGFGLSFEAEGAARRAISDDGSRVYWESGLESPLYLRDLVKHETLQVDAAEPACLAEGKCESGGGRFQIASSDGSRVYFTDHRRLTKDAGATVGEPDLYECEIVEVAGKLTCQLTDLTPTTSGKSMNVLGDVLGASEDGSTVYFVADGVLDEAAGAVQGNCRNEHGGPRPDDTCNLYVLHAGSAAKLVTVLSGRDAAVWDPQHVRPVRVSPNGSWLTFMSARSLTGYDNRDALSGQPDAEVYLYSAAANSLSCASCDPSGARPTGVEYGQLSAGASRVLPGIVGEWEPVGWVSALLPPATSLTYHAESAYQSRYLSDSGRLFFNSDDALVPQDVNGTGDVYEFEPPGVGGCSASSPQFAERAGGCIGLISSGTSSQESSFLDASESGGDVFFLTSQQLTSADIDSLGDVYDAHECSAASPCTTAPTTPPACVTEASCKAAPSPQPTIFGAPASATFSGAGNLAPPPAAKAKAKAKPATRQQKLSKALAACHRNKKKARRRACEKAARRSYGPLKKAKGKGKGK